MRLASLLANRLFMWLRNGMPCLLNHYAALFRRMKHSRFTPASSTQSLKTPTPVNAAVSASKASVASSSLPSDALPAHTKNMKLPVQEHHAEISSGEKTPEDKITNLEEATKKVSETQQPSSQTGSRDWEEGKKEKKKIEPHVVELNEKEKLIAEGARRDKDDYPTMGDIISDWDTKDEAALAKRKTEKTEEDSADDKSKKDIRNLEEKSALETSQMSEKRAAKEHEEDLNISEKRSAKEFEETEELPRKEALHLEEVRRRPTLSKRRSKEGIAKLEAEDIRKIAAELFGKKSEDEEEMPVVPEEEKGRADAREARKEFDEDQKKKKLRECQKDRADLQEKKEAVDSEPKQDTPKKEASALKDIPDSVIRDFGIFEKRQKKPKRILMTPKITEPAGKSGLRDLPVVDDHGLGKYSRKVKQSVG
ncbi:unnamed protein product [Cylicocyclus nassatus]|uniref:Uncharacterized protein n=1 Tax=Cylicocyclus nassatus TaxID=53992 RepID=A0AA36H0V7_CYLNA|nr:unnamed protein product [Cylicocyclus nassatus]